MAWSAMACKSARSTCSRWRNLTPRYHLLGSSTIHVGLIENNIRSHVCWPGGQHLLLAVDQIAGVKRRQLKAVPVRDRVGRTRLYAVPTKDTSVVIDVVNLGIAFSATYAEFGGVVGSLDVDAIRGTIGGTQKASHAFFQSVFVALQHMSAAKTAFDASSSKRTLAVGIIFYRRRLEHLHKGDAHPLGDCGDVFQNRHSFQYTESMVLGALDDSSNAGNKYKRSAAARVKTG